MTGVRADSLAVGRAEIEDLYSAYAAAIDEDLATWPDFFAPTAVYRVIARENFERGLPMATILAEGTGMLRDRVTAITQTMVYTPRCVRHTITNVRILGHDGDRTRAGANFVVYESEAAIPTRMLVVGRYLDTIEPDGRGGLRFAEKTCIYDGNIVLGSLIYPL
jgi:3-phenylpropionate/cinnamic acid dioxygenase small subunit